MMSLAVDIQGRDLNDESRLVLVRFDDGLNDLRLVDRRIVDCGEDEQASLIKRSRTSRSMVKRWSSILHLEPNADITCDRSGSISSGDAKRRVDEIKNASVHI